MRRSSACFGGRWLVDVAGDASDRLAADSLALARTRLLGWHDRYTRFSPGSELSRLNADPRPEVPVSPDLDALVDAILSAAEQTGGLVDGTLAREAADAATGATSVRRCRSRWHSGSPPHARPHGRSRKAAGVMPPVTAAVCTARPASRSTAAGWPRACAPTCSR